MLPSAEGRPGVWPTAQEGEGQREGGGGGSSPDRNSLPGSSLSCHLPRGLATPADVPSPHRAVPGAATPSANGACEGLARAGQELKEGGGSFGFFSLKRVSSFKVVFLRGSGPRGPHSLNHGPRCVLRPRPRESGLGPGSVPDEGSG